MTMNDYFKTCKDDAKFYAERDYASGKSKDYLNAFSRELQKRYIQTYNETWLYLENRDREMTNGYEAGWNDFFNGTYSDNPYLSGSVESAKWYSDWWTGRADAIIEDNENEDNENIVYNDGFYDYFIDHYNESRYCKGFYGNSDDYKFYEDGWNDAKDIDTKE